ncbi:MAG: Maf family protein, partial [Lactobacillus sp.]|nr:Maf family protein [Lactobacillus sp.]
MAVKDFILASSSPQRKALLAAIYFEPKKCEPADIDETPHKDEKPTAYVKRMAQEKALAVVKNNPGEVILASDTIIAVGLKIFQKAKDAKDQEDKVRQMSGRAHRVITAVCLINKEGKESIRVNSNKVFVKKMSEEEIKEYID